MKEIRAKFAAAVFLLVIGTGFIIYWAVSGQNNLFLFGSVAVFIAGAFTLLNSLEFLKGQLRMVAFGLLTVVSLFLAYSIYQSIQAPIKFLAEKEVRYESIIQRLKDIRQAQLAYKAANGEFAKNFTVLLDFVKYDSLTVVKSIGEIPEEMTEDSALAAGIISRDTSYVPVIDSVYGKSYMSERNQKLSFVLDSLPYVPFLEGVKFEMTAGKVLRTGIQVPVFEVKDPKPFHKEDPMIVGSMTDPVTSGNWKTEK